ncbi:hypothetical protein [Vibrio penaeicida]|uniref:Uncharacterized protein n=1 Tax=Vibrio penaeicida TaxID=104609 RepID=A0AAV5NKY0_9VIBR|nr:hypothetical protein [Vibrio penaeicida]RTZ24912.1 hypothetical protein EKN09_01180 [Vibrio penaeicida]GLQ71203.1 hypothetical protein GCM10007932_05630 [Vibrio penaeicida]
MIHRLNTLDYLKQTKNQPESAVSYLPMTLVKKALSLSSTEMKNAELNGDISIRLMEADTQSMAMVNVVDAIALYDRKINRIATIKSVLLECWNEKQIYSHSEFFGKLGFDHRNPTDRKAINEALRAIDTQCCKCGVLLSSLLYLVHGELPPQHYFQRAIELKIADEKALSTTEQKRVFWDDQLLTGWSLNIKEAVA